MRVTSLGSGSTGNAYLIEAGPQGRTRLLVDAGFPVRTLAERLRLAGSVLGQLQGVLVTHEHSDHILGLPVLMKRYHIPVFADPRTLTELRTILSGSELRSEAGTLISLETEYSLAEGELVGEEITIIQTASPANDDTTQTTLPANDDTLWRPLPAGTQILIGDIEVNSFPVSHDAIAPCGYLLSAGGCRVCIVTDTGEVTPIMLEALAKADLLVLESNHDRARLLSGPYPYHLKQRILSPTGHLSNDQAALAVLQTWRHDSVRWLWLAHLSRTNNTRKLALTSMQKSLRDAGVNLAQIHISVLSPGMGISWDSAQLWQDTSLWDM